MALTTGMRFLTGYYAAARSPKENQPEWPPHPARVFMALAAAFFDGGGQKDERAALEWLAEQGAPAIRAGDLDPWAVRPAVTAYVPANDRQAMTKAGMIEAIPGVKRHRSERLFPRKFIGLDDQTDGRVYLHWPAAEARDHLAPLEQLCARVARVGHSTSLVQMWVEREWNGQPDLVPTDHDVDVRLRVVRQPGMLRRLQEWFDAGLRPTINTWQGYRQASAAAPSALLGPLDPRLEMLRLRPQASSLRYLDSATTLRLTAALHRALLKAVDDPVPESVSGHQADGAPTLLPHVAILAVPSVGSPHSDGHLMGVALALPRDMAAADAMKLAAGLAQIEEAGLTLGELGLWRLERDVEDRERGAMLRPDTWTAWDQGATTWATVTPFVFDQHPKAKERGAYGQEAAELVRKACQRAGLPQPVAVSVGAVSAHQGVPHTRQFPRLGRKDGSLRRHLHVTIQFAEPVIGPVVVGAGRFRGYGLCKPLWDRREDRI